MELIKHPKTEIEYWQTIEGLGGFAFGMDHELADGRLSDSGGGISKDINDARHLQKQLVEELKTKFGVIPPDEYPKTELGQKLPKPPKGKTYYWVWYERMKKISYQIEYETLICSACPLSKGVGYMISTGGWIPCGPWRGMIFQLTPCYRCAMLEHWDRKKLEEEIVREGGQTALVRFKIKEAGLKALLDPESGMLKI
jgi:hypothetical protein